MNSYESYLEDIGFVSGPFVNRIKPLLDIASKMCPTEITDIIITNYIKNDLTIEFQSLWFFSDKYCLEAKEFLTKVDLDIAFFFESVKYWNIKLENYNYKKALNKRITKIKMKFGEVHYDILNKDRIIKEYFQKAKIKAEILTRVNSLGPRYQISDIKLLLTLLKIILEIKDFAVGGTPREMSKTHSVTSRFVYSLARLVFSKDMNLYTNRFYLHKFLRYDMSLLADAKPKGQITESDFIHMRNPQLQDLLDAYRKEKQKKVGNSLFTRAGIDINFTRWVKQLSEDTINNILKNHSEKLSIPKLLFICSQINKHLEILKFIVHSLKNKPWESKEISKVTGKSTYFIKKFEKLICEKKVK